MKTENLAKILACAEAAVRRGGAHALENRHRRMEVAQRLPGDIKLVLDHESQEVIFDEIHRHFPDSSILGEEGSHDAGTEGRLNWVVDPIDGTVNFSHGIPIWGSCVAAREGDRVVAGAVYLPELEELYSASLEAPAACNGTPIRASAVDRLDHAMMLTGFPKDYGSDESAIARFKLLTTACQRTRMNGSAAAAILWVARGVSDVYMERGIYLWDVAAAGFIAERAGARTLGAPMAEEHRIGFVCAAPALFERAVEIYRATLGADD
jgi:myo-inositol-1(or 4)-monophosphatase